jgi:hypothetical protein
MRHVLTGKRCLKRMWTSLCRLSLVALTSFDVNANGKLHVLCHLLNIKCTSSIPIKRNSS